ncbi:hypothetical protein NDU88_001898 [Pleurodeles waltl]|uniref:Uncharacterized protein n=1 Tax=Pleurodeles waltl TaxID=8319 RepID=A0AAV7RC80_PLEWA|nr:hypothetical protein NDU88_001898 [Pleurodeles waltl]
MMGLLDRAPVGAREELPKGGLVAPVVVRSKMGHIIAAGFEWSDGDGGRDAREVEEGLQAWGEEVWPEEVQERPKKVYARADSSEGGAYQRAHRYGQVAAHGDKKQAGASRETAGSKGLVKAGVCPVRCGLVASTLDLSFLYRVRRTETWRNWGIPVRHHDPGMKQMLAQVWPVRLHW